TREGHTVRRAFSLVEVITVAVIMGILAVSVIPAFSTIEGARGAAAADEIARLLSVARAHATATGDATGVAVNVADESITPLRINSAATATEPIPGALGVDRPALIVTATFPGVALTSVTLGDGTIGDGTIWFGHDGTPRLRDANLDDTGPATTDSVIELTGGELVRVRRLSGAIEQEAAP
ncbi:MAG: prepilin-type N-terminal cleavage/methylation domain-containing protein, partial [Phycisphaerales bacterium]|nr:prepilin-type N-terminal cleavage/methylation domain-containing protein [Phycisphaerales bacterium]